MGGNLNPICPALAFWVCFLQGDFLKAFRAGLSWFPLKSLVSVSVLGDLVYFSGNTSFRNPIHRSFGDVSKGFRSQVACPEALATCTAPGVSIAISTSPNGANKQLCFQPCRSHGMLPRLWKERPCPPPERGGD